MGAHKAANIQKPIAVLRRPVLRGIDLEGQVRAARPN
jgi:hypothetical protein